MFIWTAVCDDGGFTDESRQAFATRKEAYEDMRNAVLEKMKWNTEYDEDFEDEESFIRYTVDFRRDMIIHQSYSGTYTYVIREVQV